MNSGRLLMIRAALLLSLALAPLQAQSPSQADAFYEAAQAAMYNEDWYAAVEALLDCVRANPAHAAGNLALAESYYELAEYTEALGWVRKARALARGNLDAANLEASILVALGRLSEAGAILEETLKKEPYNREALFAAAELDIARGRPSDAVTRYRATSRVFPDDRRLLVSLALTCGALGDEEAARAYIERAQMLHPDDYRVFYYAAYLESRAGRLDEAIRSAEYALELRPGYESGRELLATLRYRKGDWDEAVRLADQCIAARGGKVTGEGGIGPWLLKGMALRAKGNAAASQAVLEAALTLSPGDEFCRAALEELVMERTALEDRSRKRWSDWHTARAESYRARNLYDQALFEYRRALRLYPYAASRRDYAELLRLQGRKERALEELVLCRDLGARDTALDDAIERLSGELSDTLIKRNNVQPSELGPHWKVAVFSVAAQSSVYHTDAGAITAAYLKDLMAHERNVQAASLPLRHNSFSEAFRSAREALAEGGSAASDYFLVVSVTEGERDIAVKGELYLSRTGSQAAVFSAYRTGDERLRNASRAIVEQLSAALPFRAALLRRSGGTGLIDKGRVDGVEEGAVYSLLKSGTPELKARGVGLDYLERDISGSFIVEKAEDEVASGTLVRSGFFDRLSAGDEVVLPPAESAPPPPPLETPADPELRTLLRTLR